VTDARRSDLLALAIVGLVPAAVFADVLLGIRGFFVRDVRMYYYPAKKILRDIILSGELPYWNPYFGAGQPMAANPEHELFYPPTWLVLLPNYDYVFHLLPLLHVLLAGFAMYAFLRSLGMGRPASCFGALAFELGGFLASTLNLFPLLFSVAWLPLLCLYTRRYLLHGARRDFAWAAVFLGLQLLVGEPTTAFQSGVLLGLYAIYRGVRDRGGAGTVARRVAAIGAISIVALLIAGVQVLPTLDHFGDSTRSRGLEYQTVRLWSMPFGRLGELFYPNLFGVGGAASRKDYWGLGFYDWSRPFYYSIYPGLLIAVAAVAGLLARLRGTWLVLLILFISVILAAGDHTPLLRLLYDSGIARSFRYFEKFILMGVFALIVFGAHSLDRLLAGDERLRKIALGCAAAVTLFAVIAAGIGFSPAYETVFRRVWRVLPEDSVARLLPVAQTAWLVAVARGVLLLLLLRNVHRARRPLWLVLAGAFVCLDLAPVVNDVAPRIGIDFYRGPLPVADELPPNRREYRIFNTTLGAIGSREGRLYRAPREGQQEHWITRNILTPITPAAYGLRTAIDGDYDLTGLLPANDFNKAAWELSEKNRRDWINILAPMSNVWYIGIYRNPARAFAEARGDVRNIRPVRFIEGLHHPRYYFASEIARARDVDDFVRQLAVRRFSRQVAFIDAEPFTPARGVVHRTAEWHNGARLDVEATGRAFLVMSVTPHKHWRITIDGAEAPAVVTNIGYQGIVVPPGRHLVEMRYRNPLVAAGGAVTIATLLALLLFARRGPAAAAEAPAATGEEAA